MCDPSDEQPGHGDIDHGVGDVDTRFVVSNEPSVAGHPSEGALDDPAAGQDLETGFGAPHDLDAEVEEGGLVEQLPPVVGAIGEQVLDPGPALMNGVENGLGAALSEMSAVVRLTHQQTPVGVHRDMALAADDFLAAIEAARAMRRRHLDDWLSITAAPGCTFRPARARSIIKVTSWMVRNIKRRIMRRSHQYTVCQGGK